jgi:4-azaleucine resistance transporter AzlC
MMDKTVTFTLHGALKGARVAVPLALATLPDGAVFGIFARQTGLSAVEAVLMSTFVCAGSAQYVALTLWGPGMAMLPLVFTTFVINLRHVLMGASIQSWFARLPPRQTYGAAYFLSDESWALTTHELSEGGRDLAFMVGSGVVLSCAWIGGTGIGHVLSGAITDPRRWGLDFAFVAVFVALLTSLHRGTRDVLPWCVAALVAVAAHRWLPHPWYILLGGVAGSVVGAWERGSDRATER